MRPGGLVVRNDQYPSQLVIIEETHRYRIRQRLRPRWSQVFVWFALFFMVSIGIEVVATDGPPDVAWAAGALAGFFAALCIAGIKR